MKKVMFALCFTMGGIVAVTAQDNQTQDTTSNQYRTETQSQFPQDAQGQNQSQDMMGQQDRERIQVTELPDEVKRSLEGQEYRGWLISGAFKAQSGQSSDSTSTDASQQPSNAATGTENEQIYIVELKNGAETKTVGFDSKGEIVEGVGNDQNGQMDQSGQTDPNNQNNQYNQNQNSDMNQPQTTPDQNDQSQSSQSATPSPEQSTSTPSGQSSQSDQSTTTDTQTQTEQSTGTQTETQTDQSRANGPK